MTIIPYILLLLSLICIICAHSAANPRPRKVYQKDKTLPSIIEPVDKEVKRYPYALSAVAIAGLICATVLVALEFLVGNGVLS